MYTDEIKLFGKNEKGLVTLTHTMRIYSPDIGVDFIREKCALLIMRIRKQHLTEGIELPNQEKIRTLREKETYKYMGILEAENMRQLKMKEKIKDSISEERESYSTPNYIAGISSKK